MITDQARGVERRSSIIEAVRSHHSVYGYGPSLSELAVAAGCSRSAVFHHVERLVRDGVLRQDRRMPRSIRLVRAAAKTPVVRRIVDAVDENQVEVKLVTYADGTREWWTFDEHDAQAGLADRR